MRGCAQDKDHVHQGLPQLYAVGFLKGAACPQIVLHRANVMPSRGLSNLVGLSI